MEQYCIHIVRLSFFFLGIFLTIWCLLLSHFLALISILLSLTLFKSNIRGSRVILTYPVIHKDLRNVIGSAVLERTDLSIAHHRLGTTDSFLTSSLWYSLHLHFYLSNFVDLWFAICNYIISYIISGIILIQFWKFYTAMILR